MTKRPIDSNLVVFTPTWNEAENIELLIRAVFEAMPEANLLVVDDQSPDGTGDIAESLRDEFPGLFVLHREGKRGRGLAGIAGYIWALDHGAEYIVEMDADFSHQPEYLPSIVRALEHADVVVGSRYIAGGKDLRPGLLRQTISRLANAYQRWMFRTKLLDCTSGYRAYHAYVLEKIGVRNLDTWGPAILSDVLYRIIKNNFKIVEVPIEFPDRSRGESTLTLKILFEGIFNVARLKFRG